MVQLERAFVVALLLTLSSSIYGTAASPIMTRVPGLVAEPVSAVEPDGVPDPEGVPEPEGAPQPEWVPEPEGVVEPDGVGEADVSPDIGDGAAPVDPVFSVPGGQGQVILTFDDGPSPQTHAILRILADVGVSAAFFWITGQNGVEMAPEVVAAGHQLGTHTASHADLTRLDRVGQQVQMSESIRRLEALSGSPVRLFRPPYGAFSDETLSVASELGLSTVLWNVDSQDWALGDSPDQILTNVLNQVQDGSIILLHEKPQTVAILPQLISSLRTQGYTFSLL